MFWGRSLAVMDVSNREIQRVGPGGGTVSPDGKMVCSPQTENRRTTIKAIEIFT
jgi:hypothetical protein